MKKCLKTLKGAVGLDFFLFLSVIRYYAFLMKSGAFLMKSGK